MSYEGNPQKLFDDVVAHLRAQNAQSGIFDIEEEKFICKYRGPDNLKCAIGGILPDELYFPKMEGLGLRKFISLTDHIREDRKEFLTLANKVGDFIGHSNELLASDLQQIHDGFTPDRWEQQFKETAKAFKLEYKEPQCEATLQK